MIIPFCRKRKKEPSVNRERFSFEDTFLEDVSAVIGSLVENGYDPYTQLTSFLHTGNACFITRAGDARMTAIRLDRDQLRRYVENIQTG